MSRFLKNVNRRRFLQAMGLGGAAALLPSLAPTSRSHAGPSFPTRVVFFITPHGTTPNYWDMSSPGMPDEADYEYDLVGRGEAEFSEILRPLHAVRDQLMILSGVSRATCLGEYHRVVEQGLGDDANAHHVGQAHLLTGNWGMQRTGATVIGGAESVDQYIGRQTADPGQWPLRVYGQRHQHEYSYVASGEPGSRISDPMDAFAEIMGAYVPPDMGGAPTRASLLRQARGSVLDHVANEYDQVIPQLSGDDQLKLERHRDLVRDLELSFAGRTAGGPMCDPTYSNTGEEMERFSRISTLALACDMTRTITFQSRHLDAADFGADPAEDIHQDIAHNSHTDADSYTPRAEQLMRDYNIFYTNQFRYLIEQLASVPEGGETLLDHTAVVWLTELATGTHSMHETPLVVAGGANGHFGTGRYIRYGQNILSPFASWGPRNFIGPGNNHLYVSLMRAMGMTDDFYGLPSVDDVDGNPISLRGELPRLA